MSQTSTDEVPGLRPAGWSIPSALAQCQRCWRKQRGRCNNTVSRRHAGPYRSLNVGKYQATNRPSSSKSNFQCTEHPGVSALFHPGKSSLPLNCKNSLSCAFPSVSHLEFTGPTDVVVTRDAWGPDRYLRMADTPYQSVTNWPGRLPSTCLNTDAPCRRDEPCSWALLMPPGHARSPKRLHSGAAGHTAAFCPSQTV